MNLWQKLTIDWPCALSDWLWAALVVAPAAWLDRLTWRLAVRIAVQLLMLVVLMWFFVEIAALHLTFLFTLDANIFLEIGATAYLLATRGPAGQRFGAATRSIAVVLRYVWQVWPCRASRQHRNRNALRRRTGDSPPSGDEPAIGVGYAFA